MGLQAVDLGSPDHFSGPSAREALAATYAWLGEEEKAIEILEELLSTRYYGGLYGSALTVWDLRGNPTWEPLRDHPRFKELLENSQ